MFQGPELQLYLYIMNRRVERRIALDIPTLKLVGATVPDFSFPGIRPSLLFLLHCLHLVLQRRDIRMDLLYRRLKSLRQCKTNQPVVSGKSEEKVISLKVYRRACPNL